MWLVLLVGKSLSRVLYMPGFELCPGTPGQPDTQTLAGRDV